MKLIPDDFKKEIGGRISKIQAKMLENSIDGIIIASNANIYYSSGRFFRGYVLVFANHEPLWFVVKPSLFEAESNIFIIRKPEQIPSLLKDQGIEMPLSIGLEEDELSYSTILRLQKLFPESTPVNASPIMKQARITKTDWEINEMKYDGRQHVKVYEKIKECYRPGMTDLGFQIEIEKILRLHGALGVSRVAGNLMEINLGSVISGDNADNPGPYDFTMGGEGMNPALPVGANNKPIKEGQTVMIDMNGAFNGYQTDMTRVWSLGETSELANKAHQCSIKILRALEKSGVPGTPVKNLYSEALSIVEEDDLKEYFMGHKTQVSFIGHGVGIELNELPVVNASSRDILQENMTIALEPKFVIPHVGAVGVENTYVVTKSGLENITVFPEEIQNL